MAQKLICVSKQESQLYCSYLTGEEDGEEEEEEEKEEEEEVGKWQGRKFVFPAVEKKENITAAFSGMLVQCDSPALQRKGTKKGGRTW